MRTGHYELAATRSDGMLNIRRAAAASGVSVEMIRPYEASGLPPAAGGAVARYRIHRHGDAKRLPARHMHQLDEKSGELQSIRDSLAHWTSLRVLSRMTR